MQVLCSFPPGSLASGCRKPAPRCTAAAIASTWTTQTHAQCHIALFRSVTSDSQSSGARSIIQTRTAAALRRQSSCGAAIEESNIDTAKQPYALVTGASSGIGKSTAVLLAKSGWKVFGTVRCEADGAALTQLHSNIAALQMDVTDGDTIAAAARQVADETGGSGLAALVNNAGRAITAPLEHLPLPVLREQLEVNLIGAVAVTQAFLPLLRAGASPGRIVNIGSQSGVVATPMFAPYAMSKFAMEAMSDSLRLELADQGIKVILIRPGAVRTPIWSKSTGEAAALVEKMPPEGAAHYGTLIRQVQAAAAQAERSGVEASAVAEAVATSLTLQHPRARSVVGTAAAVQMALRRLLPDAVWDRLLMRTLAKKGREAAWKSESGRL